MVDSVVENKSHKRYAKIIWLVVIIATLSVLGLVGWLSFKLINNKSVERDVGQAVPSAQNTQNASPSIQKADTESDYDLLKKAVSEKTGIPINKIVLEISENTGKHAKGLISEKDEQFGGGYWLALKTDGRWTIVYDGQNTPECAVVDPSGFPIQMVPECYDSSGNVITRK